jgi:hypothetical protein
MSIAKRLALIAVGYALSVVGGLAAVAVNKLLIPEDVKETSGGMVAFGDMILFVLVTGFLGLVPTWFLLKLLAEKAPRTLLAILLLVAAIGPASWLAMTYLARGLPNHPEAVGALFGLFIAFVAVPRIVLGPILLVIEAATFFLVRTRVMRVLLIAAMLMDLIPLGIYALHFARTIHR